MITVTNGKISWAAQAGATSFKGAATNSSGINYLSLQRDEPVSDGGAREDRALCRRVRRRRRRAVVELGLGSIAARYGRDDHDRHDDHRAAHHDDRGDDDDGDHVDDAHHDHDANHDDDDHDANHHDHDTNHHDDDHDTEHDHDGKHDHDGEHDHDREHDDDARASAAVIRASGGRDGTDRVASHPQMKSIGVTWDRIDVGDGSDIFAVQYAASQGVKTLVLYNPNLGGRSPSQVASEVKSLAQRIQPLGLTEIEFGNEVYYDGKTTPQSYAAQYAAAHAAVAGMGVKLIANSLGDYQRPDGSWSQDSQGAGWIHDFLAALPSPSVLDAFSVHPYGSLTSLTNGEDDGWLEVPRYHDLAVKYGADVPWYITEVGQCLGGAGCSNPTGCERPVGRSHPVPQ